MVDCYIWVDWLIPVHDYIVRVTIQLSETYQIALGAVYAVKVTYSNIQTPLIDLIQAIRQKSFFPKPCDDMVVGKPDGEFCTFSMRDRPKTFGQIE